MPARVYAADPHKRWMERFVVVYTPAWIAVVAALVLSRAFARFGDVFHLALGLGLAAPIWFAPLFAPDDRPLARRYATRFAAFVTGMSLIQCYFGSWLFFDVLGMEYHFPVTWILNRTPVFLYFMTVAYFATYYVAMSLAWRAFSTAFPRAPMLARLGARIVLGYSVAFAETGGMATAALHPYFSYRDKAFALLWGSLFYGSAFVLSLPFFYRVDEEEGGRPALGRLMVDMLAANMLVLMAYEVFAKIATSYRR